MRSAQDGVDVDTRFRATVRSPRRQRGSVGEGAIAASLLAFSLSIDDVVITNFTAGQTVTFPMFIWGSARVGVSVQVNVIGTIIFLTAVGAVS